MKRQRGRGRKPGGGGGGGGHHNNQGHHHPNRTLESNGPEGKVRGPASLIYERYLQLGRDASSAGDRVLAENFLQHADHYFRIVRAMQPATPPPQERSFNEGDYDNEEDGSAEGETSASASEAASADIEQPEGEFASGPPQNPGAERDRGDGDFRRRRGRRNRFRPGGGEGADEGEVRENREPREAPREAREPEANAEPRRERSRDRSEPRERDGGPEGFSGSPRPAFLRPD